MINYSYFGCHINGSLEIIYNLLGNILHQNCHFFSGQKKNRVKGHELTHPRLDYIYLYVWLYISVCKLLHLITQILNIFSYYF